MPDTCASCTLRDPCEAGLEPCPSIDLSETVGPIEARVMFPKAIYPRYTAFATLGELKSYSEANPRAWVMVDREVYYQAGIKKFF